MNPLARLSRPGCVSPDTAKAESQATTVAPERTAAIVRALRTAPSPSHVDYGQLFDWLWAA